MLASVLKLAMQGSRDNRPLEILAARIHQRNVGVQVCDYSYEQCLQVVASTIGRASIRSKLRRSMV